MISGIHKSAPARSVFISDLHLGTRDCQAQELAEFLRNTEMETLFLVGDVVDLWGMRRGIYWPASHHDVLRLMVEKARRGTRDIYVPVKHDELASALCGSLLAGGAVQPEFVHTTCGGRRLPCWREWPRSQPAGPAAAGPGTATRCVSTGAIGAVVR